MRCFRWLFVGAVAVVVTAALQLSAANKDQAKPVTAEFTPLFRGKDLEAWRVPKGDNNHWKLTKDGLIDYDARSEARGEKHLWTRKSYRDFVLRLDWRLKNETGRLQLVPLLDTDGQVKKDPKGRE